MIPHRFGISSLVVLLAFLASPAAQACAVCFGRTDSPLGKGLHWGVLALLGFVALMLSAFAVFAVFLARRSMAMESDAEFHSNQGSAPDGASPSVKAH